MSEAAHRSALARVASFVARAIDGDEAPRLSTSLDVDAAAERLRVVLATHATIEGSVFAHRVHAHMKVPRGASRVLGLAYRGELERGADATVLRGRFAASRAVRTLAWLGVAGLVAWAALFAVAAAVGVARGEHALPLVATALAAAIAPALVLVRLRDAGRALDRDRVVSALRAALDADADAEADG